VGDEKETKKSYETDENKKVNLSRCAMQAQTGEREYSS
jgi:hypothetical protein